ncbi:MAG: MotA/TolQ/ExbB proton channel family protein [Pseudomonadota bacterium]
MIDLGSLLHTIVDYLLWPVIVSLLMLTILVIIDCGVAIGEAFGGLTRLQKSHVRAVEALARTRISRADLAARIGPSLGLMGTLIPLGPGIAAMGRGDFQTLSAAIATAFDTTVLGLAIGMIGYLIGRWRRRAYDQLLTMIEAKNA